MDHDIVKINCLESTAKQTQGTGKQIKGEKGDFAGGIAATLNHFS